MWVVGAVIADSLVQPTRLLAARRRTVPLGHGPWEFPGGKVEPGETPRDALARELREELGIDAVIADEIDEPRCGWVISESMRLRLFLAETADTPQPGPDHDHVVWLELDQVESLEWSAADADAVPTVMLALRELFP